MSATFVQQAFVACKPIDQSMKGLYFVFNPTSQLFFDGRGGGYTPWTHGSLNDNKAASTSLPAVYQHLTLMSNAVDTWCCHIPSHTLSSVVSCYITSLLKWIQLYCNKIELEITV